MEATKMPNSNTERKPLPPLLLVFPCKVRISKYRPAIFITVKVQMLNQNESEDKVNQKSIIARFPAEIQLAIFKDTTLDVADRACLALTCKLFAAYFNAEPQLLTIANKLQHGGEVCMAEEYNEQVAMAPGACSG